MTPVPTARKAYSMLIIDGKQRELQHDSHVFSHGSVSFHGGANSSSSYHPGSSSSNAFHPSSISSSSYHHGSSLLYHPGSSSSFHPGSSSSSTPSYNNSRTFSQRVNFDPKKSSLICKYYKKPGHTVDKSSSLVFQLISNSLRKNVGNLSSS
ncbi:hypothetical protein K7X08_011614 [Anisodus acutangulus]|uniref:Uncharacterized protein n=1 Tax=Anisodus acutangulus TaxID=402998 RepID=A0A9Q1RIQ2_9SOLA|nr:hypothetical protein K7X08_011614 [Anisodus acutangulus]